MTIKRFISRTAITFLVICVIGSLLLLSVLLYGPVYIEKEVIPEIAGKASLKLAGIKVGNIGVKGAELSDVIIGEYSKNAITIDSISFDYSLWGLLNRTIDRVTICGLSLAPEYSDTGLSIPGLNDLTDRNKINSSGGIPPSKPVIVKKLHVLNSKVLIKYNKESFTVPFSLSASSFSQYDLPEYLRLSLFVEGNEITVKVKSAENSKIILSAASDDLSLNSMENFPVDFAWLYLKGRINFTLSSQLLLPSRKLEDISGSLTFYDLEIKYSDFTLKNTEKNIPVELSFESENAAKWRYRCSPVLITGPSQNLVSDFKGSVDLSGDSLNGRISARTFSDGNDKIPAILWDIYASQKESNSIGFQLKGKADPTVPAKSFRLESQGVKLEGSDPDIQIDAEYGENKLISSYGFALKNIRIRDKIMNLFVPSVSIKGKAVYVPEKGGQADSSFSIESSKVIFNGYDIKAEIPEPVINASVKYDDKSGINADARLVFKNGLVSGSAAPFEATGLSGTIPVSWPFNEKKKKGKLSIETLFYDDFSAGPLEAEYLQTENKISIDGELLWPLLPDMRILLSADMSLTPLFEKGTLNLKIPSYQPAGSIDLKKFNPELEDSYLYGKFDIGSNIEFSSSGLKGEAFLDIYDGRFSNDDKDMLLENISLRLKIKDLFSVTSGPGQHLKIDKIVYGTINANDFNMDFRIDPGNILSVEQGEFKWAEGKIDIKSFKVNPEKDEYDITLFCDRLKLAEILGQLSVASASGGGTVNGKIPLKISRGKISFEDGFLYSTPGGGGKINITETDILTAGLSPDSPEYAQMDIAREALKAFDYSWVKMSLNSDKEELLLKLQFDGKPENKLPFRYNKEFGRFIRVDTSAEGSNFQGISLDVNFRVPLNEILNYKDLLNMIE